MRRPHRARAHHRTATVTTTVIAAVTAAVTSTALALVGLAAAPATATPRPVPTTAPAPAPPTEYSGELAGARYRVLVPQGWNGTLVLFSHGHYPSEFFGGFPAPHVLGNQQLSEKTLTDHGYAVAASLFQNDGLDFTVPTAVADQSRLLDWFSAHVGEPARTITYGQSMGAVTAVKHAEVEPDRIDGVLTVGGVIDWVGQLDAILDMNVATRELLTDGTDAHGKPIELVHAADPQASRDALVAALAAAAETPQGRARISLIASLNTVTGWYEMNEPRPEGVEAWARGQAQWLIGAYTMGLGPTARVHLETTLGGNPSSTDLTRLRTRLARSGDAGGVRAAYAAAGLDLGADLAALEAATPIVADPSARAAMVAHRPEGTTPSPVLTLHTTGDGGAPPSGERSFAQRVRAVGDPARLRSLYVDRGAHLSVNLGEELVALRTLERRIDTGRWPSLAPRLLDRAANALGPDYRATFEVVTLQTFDHAPAFTHFVPPRAPRPSW
ncbi:alpha/beta hydrolase family protein [Isoptericola sp. NPDC057191]|uniref:alpha/beta hydrolase family protein n=1 Tax=Isoptericola sp. NPDC057191 TaxID=3346041 RepID=UPI00362DF771